MTEYDIQGTVTDVDGNPVQGVPVYLVNEENVNNVVSTTTDSNGDYIFESHPDVQTSNDTYFVAAGGYDSNNNLVTSSSNPNVTADLRPEFFDVSISSTNSPVVEGNDLNVNYSVNNTAGPGTQDIVLDIDGTQEDLDTVTLDPSASTSGTLTWSTVDGDNGSYTATVSSDDDSASTGVTIEKDTIQASGGTTVTDATIDGQDYRIHAFENTGSDEFSVSRAPSGETIDVLVVAGGGSGPGYSSGGGAGGGGAGGVAFASNYNASTGSFSITVGKGGDPKDTSSRSVGNNGNDSFFEGIQSIGGGGGAASSDSFPANDGGSGGGSADDSGRSPGQGLQPGTNNNAQDFGNDGGPENTNEFGGGGGGASEQGEADNGSKSGDGGDGVYFGDVYTESFGENGHFGGGGGGGTASNDGDSGFGGIGGGGRGEGDDNSNRENGQPNTGGGGGAGTDAGTNSGGGGGSGIVLIRYRI